MALGHLVSQADNSGGSTRLETDQIGQQQQQLR
jgi:hypothetical protein